MGLIVRNEHERRAWDRLLALGATAMELGGKLALDVSTVRVRSREVAGRSGSVRRHVDRQNRPVFVVTDDPAARTVLGGQ